MKDLVTTDFTDECPTILLELTKHEAETLQNLLSRVSFASVTGYVIIMMQIETKLKELLTAEGNKEKKKGKRFQFDKCSSI